MRGEHLHSGSSYKRLEQGVFQLPRSLAESHNPEVAQSDLSLILEGIDLSGARRRKRYAAPSYSRARKRA